MNEINANLGRITEDEVTGAIKELKNNKSAGMDQIPAELLKSGGKKLISELTNILNKCWNDQKVPKEWKEGIIIKIPKKGNLADCNNWRGITLLSVTGKVFCSILLKRLKDEIDLKLREEQAGFRKNRSCSEQIFTLRNIIEQSLEFQQSMIINFIDFKKAFDSIHRETMWNILELYGIPKKFINIFRTIYENSSCCIKTEDGTTEFFKILTGVRQGCNLSPFLFLVVIDYILRTAMNKENYGITWGKRDRLTDLDFADDIALLATDREKLKEMTTSLEKTAEKVGLRISSEKSKIMEIGNQTNKMPIMVNNQEIEETTKFPYLGSIITHDGDTEADIKCRIGKAMAIFQKMTNIWRSKKISTEIKINLYKSIILPIVTYASETWRITTKLANRLNVFHHRCIRRILNINYKEHITNEEILERSKLNRLEDIITERRMKMTGHILRLPNERPAKIALSWTPTNGKRKRGRPVKT